MQGRSKSLSANMTNAQYRHVFGRYVPEECTKRITTEYIYPDGRRKTKVREEQVGGQGPGI